MTAMKGENGLARSVGGHWQPSDQAPLDQLYPADFQRMSATTRGGTVVPAAQKQGGPACVPILKALS